MPPMDFHSKYKNLCSKADQVQMVAGLYAPSISESVEKLYKLMNCYWGYFHVVLATAQKEEKVDYTTLSYQEAVNYSRMIPAKVYDIRQQIGEIAHLLANYSE